MTDLETTTSPPEGVDGWRSVRRWVRRGGLLGLIRGHGILLALVILIVVGAALSPHFLTVSNVANVARQASIVGILGVGMTFVILTAGIDLSVGSIVGFVAIGSASVLAAGVPWPIGILCGLGMGAVIGAINGLGITKGRLQPFIMTLGMLVVARGVTMTYSKGQPVPLREAGPAFSWLGGKPSSGCPFRSGSWSPWPQPPVSRCGTRRSVARSTPWGTTRRRPDSPGSTPTE